MTTHLSELMELARLHNWIARIDDTTPLILAAVDRLQLSSASSIDMNYDVHYDEDKQTLRIKNRHTDWVYESVVPRQPITFQVPALHLICQKLKKEIGRLTPTQTTTPQEVVPSDTSRFGSLL